MILSSTVDWTMAARAVSIVVEVAAVAILALIWRRQRLQTRRTLAQVDRLIVVAQRAVSPAGAKRQTGPGCEIISLAERRRSSRPGVARPGARSSILYAISSVVGVCAYLGGLLIATRLEGLTADTVRVLAIGFFLLMGLVREFVRRPSRLDAARGRPDPGGQGAPTPSGAATKADRMRYGISRTHKGAPH
jgi:hypothetical protein